jgi:hypothetical protein
MTTTVNSITCPQCGHVIPLAEAMQILVESGLEGKIKGERERLQLEAQASVKQAEEKLRAEQEKKLQEFHEREERAKADAAERIREMEQREAQAKQEAEKIKAENETALAYRTRELETKEAQLRADAEKLQLENERTLREAQSRLEGEVRTKLEMEAKLKDAENITLMASMTKQIDELKRKAENASQQLIGESQEIALEDALRVAFPLDIIEPVQKGMKGADCIQKVKSGENVVGIIVWESKRTKAWLNEWIPKLKDDMRTLNATLSILVTQTPPSDMKIKADIYDGVWITDFPTAIPMATALRAGILSVASVETLASGSDEKSQKLFSFITSQEFRGNMQAIIEVFVACEADLAAEKRAAEKQWKRREVTNKRALTATHRIYGSLQGLLGEVSMPEIEVHEQKQIEA